MSFGKKSLTGKDIAKLQTDNENARLHLTEQYMLDKMDGRTSCRFCLNLLDGPKSCPKCSIFKKM